MKKNKVIVGAITGLLVTCGVSTVIYAQSKVSSEDLLMQNNAKIAALEQEVHNLQSNHPTNGGIGTAISPDVKQALVKEAGIYISSIAADGLTNKSTMKIDKIDIIKKDGKDVLQAFTEGDNHFGYTHVPNQWGETFDDGRFVVYNFINEFEPIAKMYGVNLIYEFYQNGVKANFLEPGGKTPWD